jgi:hypothetical protein
MNCARPGELLVAIGDWASVNFNPCVDIVMISIVNEFKFAAYVRLFKALIWRTETRRTKLQKFTSRSRIFHLYGNVPIAGEGLQNLDLCSALRAFEQGGIFIMPHLL